MRAFPKDGKEETGVTIPHKGYFSHSLSLSPETTHALWQSINQFILEAHNIIPKISIEQLKVTHIKNQENLNLNEKRHSTDINTEMTQMLEISENNFKTAILKLFQ